MSEVGWMIFGAVLGPVAPPRRTEDEQRQGGGEGRQVDETCLSAASARGDNAHTPPRQLCKACCGSGLGPVTGYSDGSVYQRNPTCHRCNGTGFEKTTGSSLPAVPEHAFSADDPTSLIYAAWRALHARAALVPPSVLEQRLIDALREYARNHGNGTRQGGRMSDEGDEIPKTMTIEAFRDELARQLGRVIGSLVKDAQVAPEVCYMVASIQGFTVVVGGGISADGGEPQVVTPRLIAAMTESLRDTMEESVTSRSRLLVEADPETGEVTMHDVKREDGGSN